MKIRYQLRTLSERAKAFHEEVLMTELELQTWYSVAFIPFLNSEVFLTLH